LVDIVVEVHGLLHTQREHAPNETEISHGRVSWPIHRSCFAKGAVGFIDG
jgi:hypothetical protein